MKRHNHNRPRFQGATNNGPKPMFFVHLGQRFALPSPPDGYHYVRQPNNKLVRRMERRNIMQHGRQFTIMHKLTQYRRELHALMPRPGKHPREKRAEKRRRMQAQAIVVGDTKVDPALTDAVLRSGK